jgi:hypothetical protein
MISQTLLLSNSVVSNLLEAFHIISHTPWASKELSRISSECCLVLALLLDIACTENPSHSSILDLFV